MSSHLRICLLGGVKVWGSGTCSYLFAGILKQKHLHATLGACCTQACNLILKQIVPNGERNKWFNSFTQIILKIAQHFLSPKECGCLFERSSQLYFWKVKEENSCSGQTTVPGGSPISMPASGIAAHLQG